MEKILKYISVKDLIIIGLIIFSIVNNNSNSKKIRRSMGYSVSSYDIDKLDDKINDLTEKVNKQTSEIGSQSRSIYNIENNFPNKDEINKKLDLINNNVVDNYREILGV